MRCCNQSVQLRSVSEKRSGRGTFPSESQGEGELHEGEVEPLLRPLEAGRGSEEGNDRGL